MEAALERGTAQTVDATLFYNGTGGILIFLDSLVPTLPHSSGIGHGASALPVSSDLIATR